jgi:hypothetical protein
MLGALPPAIGIGWLETSIAPPEGMQQADGSTTAADVGAGFLFYTAPIVLPGFLLIGNPPEALALPRGIVAVVPALLPYGLVAKPLQGKAR